MSEVRKCKHCDLVKPYSEFYKRTNGSLSGYRCKECSKQKARIYSMVPENRSKRLVNQKQAQTDNREKYVEYGRLYYASKRGRAKSLLKSTTRRSTKFDEVSDLDYEFILKLLDNEFCAVTGIKFDYSRSNKSSKNPYAPSLDRIDSNVGYLKSNVRLVIWQYNLMKGEITDDELYLICKEIVSAR